MEIVRVNLGPRSYDVAITGWTPADFGEFARRALPKSRAALVVADANTAALGRQFESMLGALGIRTGFSAIPAGEQSKSLDELSRLYEALYSFSADRAAAVVAVGGGVVGDLAGFAAATYNRGLALLVVPTSLLAMVDSAVGGKTGINLPGGKNLVGAFHQPAGVWIDSSHLATLPEREFRSGLAEVVKYGVSLDSELFAYLEANPAAILAREPAAMSHIIAQSCRLKARVVEQDEREETGLRAILNYGHTFAHAFESVGGYGAWLHGEAVAAGMASAARLAVRLGKIDEQIESRQNALLGRFALPARPDGNWPIDELLAVMKRDKKTAAGRMRFVLPSRLGAAELVDDVPEPLVRDVLEGR